MKAAALLTIVMAGGALRAAVRAELRQENSYRAASPEIEDFVRQAIEDRFKAGDIPDLGLLDARAHVPLLRELPRARLQLSHRALPVIDGTTFELMGLDEARLRADRTRAAVAYLTVDDPRIDGDTGSLRLGADLTMPAKPGGVKTCCCVGRAEFRRAQSLWVFVKWSAMTCA